MTQPCAPPPRRRAFLVLSCAAAAAACFFSAVRSLSEASALSAFAFAGPAPHAVAAASRGRVALRAGDEVVEAEVAEPEPAKEVKSVFDGPVSTTFKRRYMGRWYLVDRSDWTFTLLNKDGETTEKGDWMRAFNMPMKSFKRREKSLRQRWRAKLRKNRIKHGMGQRWPNGKYIFIAKMQGSIFTREKYGEKYVGRAAWHHSPNEIPARERQMRALALKRRLEQEAEEKRIERLRELGVWPGEQTWRRPWQPKVDLTPPGMRKKS